MKIKDFSFELPDELIAQYPPEQRGTSRLLVLNKSTGKIEHKTMQDFPDLIDPDTLVVFNNSRVRKSRLYGLSDTGGRVECFLLKMNEDFSWEILVSKSKKQRTGKHLVFPEGLEGTIKKELPDGHRIIEFNQHISDEYLDKNAHIPLPPYIKREDRPEDGLRYQTIYSKEVGSSAAPTAGLHFTEDIISRIENRGVETAYVTLHVGLGTFAPVRSENLLEHQMHSEDYMISRETTERIEKARKQGRKILAVGTTSVRTLESSWKDDHLSSGFNSTRLFIYPGYQFKVVDQIFTNFHTPESTLLVLVSAFAGQELINKAYNEAIAEKYRFFSYGDAMYIV